MEARKRVDKMLRGYKDEVIILWIAALKRHTKKQTMATAISVTTLSSSSSSSVTIHVIRRRRKWRAPGRAWYFDDHRLPLDDEGGGAAESSKEEVRRLMLSTAAKLRTKDSVHSSLTVRTNMTTYGFILLSTLCLLV